jgi:hypothetical protein
MRLAEAVRQQNAEERADQRGADVVADFRRRTVDVAHRDDDAEHGGDDAEPGSASPIFDQRRRRPQRFS